MQIERLLRVLLISLLMLLGANWSGCTSTSSSAVEDPVKGARRGKRKYAIEPKAGGKAPGTEYPPATPVPVDGGPPKNEAAILGSAGSSAVVTNSQKGKDSADHAASVSSPGSAAHIPTAAPSETDLTAGTADSEAARPPAPTAIPVAALPPKLVATQALSGACLPWPRQVPPGMPVYLKEKNFVVTRLLTACTLPDGTPGYDRNTQWMAMGIPCTGGRGKIDWTDKYVAPKQVAFQLSNSCPMTPTDSAGVIAAAKSMLGLGDGAKLLGYTSFSPQFWEVIGQNEADSGFAVELRSPQSLGNLWTKVRDGQPLRVRLYGRENAWLQGDFTYEVEADIVVTEKNRFKMVLISVKPLNDVELAEAKQRCESLRPKRNCSAAF